MKLIINILDKLYFVVVRRILGADDELPACSSARGCGRPRSEPAGQIEDGVCCQSSANQDFGRTLEPCCNPSGVTLIVCQSICISIQFTERRYKDLLPPPLSVVQP